MKKILLATLFLVSLSVYARGGGSFGGGRSSSFSSPSRSSSFSSPSRSSGTSSSGRSSWFSRPSPRSGTPDGANSPSSKSGQSKPFTQSSRGYFGGGNSTPTRFSPSGKTIYSAKSALDESPRMVSTPTGQSISVYHYYYPTYYYGSGYSWYHYYFYYHMFGNHSYCYHQGGGYAVPRNCQKIEDCAHGETCDITKKQCVLRTGEWTN
jgi:hypothetical protein